MEKKLGKIKSVRFGKGGYQNACLGISFSLGDGSIGVGDFKGFWDSESMKHTTNCQWSEEDRNKSYAETMRYVSKLLNEAKVNCISDLKDIPIEMTFEGNMLKEWRILTEVI